MILAITKLEDDDESEHWEEVYEMLAPNRDARIDSVIRCLKRVIEEMHLTRYIEISDRVAIIEGGKNATGDPSERSEA